MNTEVKPTAEVAQTREDKFFGITTDIEDMNAEPTEEGSDIIIEHTEEVADQVATPGAPALKDTGATDADIDDYGTKVQKRFDKLTYQAREAERQRDAVLNERDEAYRVAKHLYGTNQQQATIISTGEARLVDQIKATAALAVETAGNKYKKAHEEGDTEEILTAQKDMIVAQSENKAALDYDREYQSRVASWAAQQQAQQLQQQQQPQQRQQQQQPQTRIRKPSQAGLEWAKDNPWFNDDSHRDMTAIAYATHETMIRDEGIQPDSPEYFEKLNNVVRHRFPEYFGGNTGNTSTSTNVSKPSAVVASASRAGSKTRTVRLNATQRSLAKAIGISEAVYAKQLLKEQSNG